MQVAEKERKKILRRRVKLLDCVIPPIRIWQLLTLVFVFRMHIDRMGIHRKMNFRVCEDPIQG